MKQCCRSTLGENKERCRANRVCNFVFGSGGILAVNHRIVYCEGPSPLYLSLLPRLQLYGLATTIESQLCCL